MFKFFRNTRRRLLRENRFTRYLIYAIGEIVLVVIGILIALQIDEWNNERNRQQWENEVLSQVRTDLNQSQGELIEISAFYLEMAKASANVLRIFWKDEIPYKKDSLRDLLYMVRGSRVYSPPLGNMKALMNSGKIDLVNDPEIRTAINTYLEKIDYSLKDVDRYEETYFRKAQEKLANTLTDDIRTFEEVIERNKKIQVLAETDKDVQEFLASDLNTIPLEIDRIPFPIQPEELFQSKDVFIAFRWYLIAHRNRHLRYEDMLDYTNDLLKVLNNNVQERDQ